MRYERKYRIENASLSQVELVIRQNPACFQMAFPDRRINSIYLDDIAFNSLNENLAGISKRNKFRIRWYGDTLSEVKKPTLEIKIKNNFTNTKDFFKLPDFTLTPAFDCVQFIETHIPNLQQRLFPVSIIQYLRSYYVSQNGKVRATIDRKLNYYLYQGRLLMQHSPAIDHGIILEIKYDKDYDDQMQPIFQMIPFRLTKNSKYVSSINAHYI